MARKQDVPGFINTVEEKHAARIPSHPLRQAAMRLADIRRAGSRLKTKDLIGLLISHGARAWRNSLPEVGIKLRVVSPTGRTAVKIRL